MFDRVVDLPMAETTLGGPSWASFYGRNTLSRGLDASFSCTPLHENPSPEGSWEVIRRVFGT